jgi:gliding motility-associated-like protein
VPLNENLEYCYYVTTQGSYGNDALAEPLINNSQIICGQPNDKTPPCGPVNFVLDETFGCDAVLQSQSCDFSAFSNKLSWEKDPSDGCEDDVRSFNIYFSETGAEGSFNLIDNVITSTYRHVDLTSFKGCYKISAVDRSGNESELSEAVCNDNCPYFELPNVFTPNGDGRNDVFRPFYDDGTITGFDRAKCIRFVDAVVFTVFDRTGNAIYNFTSAGVENSILIDWDGRTNEGSELPSGVYFYTADVTFDVLDPKQMNKQYKGWVQIMK